jgi:hypothetical protein
MHVAAVAAAATLLIPSVHFCYHRASPRKQPLKYQATLPALAATQCVFGVGWIVSIEVCENVPLHTGTWLICTMHSAWYMAFARRATLLACALSEPARRFKVNYWAPIIAFVPLFFVSWLATAASLESSNLQYRVALAVSSLFQLAFICLCLVPVAPALPSAAGIKKAHILGPILATCATVPIVFAASLAFPPSDVLAFAAALIVPMFQLAATLPCVRPTRPHEVVVYKTLHQTLGSPASTDLFFMWLGNIDKPLVDEWRQRTYMLESPATPPEVKEAISKEGTAALRRLEEFFAQYLQDVSSELDGFAAESSHLIRAGFFASAITSSVPRT